MATLFNISEIIKPINDGSPTGQDIRLGEKNSKIYYEIKDARTSARTFERQQIQDTQTPNKANWNIVYNLAIDILINHTKDLEIATWLTEAALREFGFKGLLAGFELIKQLIEIYWDGLYPMPDEDGAYTRIAAFIGLNGEESEGTLIIPIALTPLIQVSKLGSYSLWQYQQSLELLKITDTDKRAMRIAEGGITLDMFRKSINEIPKDNILSNLNVLFEIKKTYETLIKLLTEKCGNISFSSSRILHQLEACIDCLQTLNTATLMTEESMPHPTAFIPLTDHVPVSIHTDLNLNTREQALQMLLQAADYFRLNEPHSPIPYVLQRAVRWAKMPLPELLKELLPDTNVQSQLTQLTGINFDHLISK